MNPPYANGGLHTQSNALPEPALPAPQRDWSNMTRTIAHYERIEQIGEGTYGQVYRARCKDTNQIVALKKIRVHHGDYWGMPPTVIREIKILKRLRHKNLVQMVEVVSSKGVEHLDEDDEVMEKHKPSKKDRIIDAREGYKGNLFLVLEYVSHDLTGLMDVAYRFSEVQVKCIFRQLLEALQYMHDNKYVHRDIKSSNILIDHNYRVKLADFGLARCIEPPILDKIHDRGNSQEFTNKVITLWYRPPELLLGATKYGTPVDIWSAGCILAELILGKPLFTGKSEMDQLQLIFDMLGSPTPESWDGLQDLKLLRTGEVTIGAKRKGKLRNKYQSKISGPALNLIEKLLELDPKKRLTANRALESRYLKCDPRPPDRPEELGTLLVEGGHFHEFQTKKKRKEAKAVAEKTRQAALEGGRSEKEAQEEFDVVYRGIMEKVAKEGLDAGPKAEKKNLEARNKASTEEKLGKSERKRSSRDKEREARKERKASKEDRKREGKDRDKGRSSRRKADSEDLKGEDDKRRRRRRDEVEAKEYKDETQIGKKEGDGNQNKPAITQTKEDAADDGNGAGPKISIDSGKSAKNIDPLAKDRTGDKAAFEEEADRKSRSSRSRRDRSRSRDRSREHRSDRERRSSHGDRRRSRDYDRDRDRERDRERRRRGHESDRDRDRNRDRNGRDYAREGDWGRDRDRDAADWGRGGRDRERDRWDGPPPSRGEFDRRQDFGPRVGPYDPPRGGDGPPPDYRGGPRPRDFGSFGPANGDYRGPPPGGQGPPPGYYDEQRRRGERERSPRRDHDYGRGRR